MECFNCHKKGHSKAKCWALGGVVCPQKDLPQPKALVNVAIVRNGVVVNVSDHLMRFSPFERLNNENRIVKGSSVIVTDNTVCSIVDRRLRTTQWVDDTADPDTQPDAYLAPHQQVAIAAFFERINSFGSRLLNCSTCKESYQCITECGRTVHNVKDVRMRYFTFPSIAPFPVFKNTVRRFYLAQKTSF
jgi:hypothetical protein